MKNPSTSSKFWTLAFAGATPPSALGLALQEGLVPQHDFDSHGAEWVPQWLSGVSARMATDPYDVAHRPWRPFGGAGSQTLVQQKANLPARLKTVKPGTVEADLLSVFQGFHRMGWDFHQTIEAKNKDGVWATSLLEAAVAMNLPSVVDWAASLPDKRPAKELDESRAPLNTMGTRTPLPWLHAAALGWQDSLVEALLDYGLDVNQVNKQGQTALFFARTVRTVNALVAAGIDVSRPDKNGRTAVEHWQTVKDFPGGSNEKSLSEALGSSAKTDEVTGAKLVLYLSKGPFLTSSMDPGVVAKGVGVWWEGVPKWDNPFHAARMNPGGIWKGMWSPAAWYGLQALQGGMFYNAHTPSLLARPDFLSPEDYIIKGKLTERGLFGLGVLRIGFKWGTRNALGTVLGKDWLTSPQWLEPMQKASKALLDVKSTNQEIRYSIRLAWRNYFSEVGVEDPGLGLKLWEAKTKASVAFDRTEDWSKFFDVQEPSLRATLYLLCAGDIVRKKVRENPNQTAEDSVKYDSDFKQAWTTAQRGFHEAGQFAKVDGEMEAAVDSVIDMLSSFRFLQDEVAILKHHRLEKALEPGTPRSGAKPRM